MNDHIEIPTAKELKKAYENKAKAESIINRVSLDPYAPPKIIDRSNCTDLGNARLFVNDHQENLRYCYPWKSWIYWTGENWKRDNDGEVMRRAKATVENIKNSVDTIHDISTKEKIFKHAINSESKGKIISMVELAQSEPTIPILPEQMDLDKWLFNVKNGTINLRTGILERHSKDNYITKLSPVVFDTNAKCPLWLNFLDRIFSGNNEVIEYVQKIAGQSLTGDTSEEQLYIFWGTGANGKSRLLGAIEYILGDYVMTIGVETLLEKKMETISNEIARLKGSRLVIASEPDFGKNLSEGKIKTLTGRDTINARFLYQESFQFKPEFKLIIATNHKPGIKGADHGIWRRLKLVPFSVTIPLEERDKTLDIKLKTEASGILNWMIEGCLKWQKEGNIDPPVVTEATLDYQDEMDILSEFFNFCTIKDTFSRTPHNILYTTYKLWAENNDSFPMSKIAFTQVCIERGFKPIRTRDKDGHLYRGFQGVGVTDMLLQSVTDYLCADTTRKYEKKNEVCDRFRTFSGNFFILNSKENPDNISHICHNCHTTPIIPNNTSVTSVTSVTKKIIILLKEKYQNFNIPKMNGDLKRLKDSMLLFLMTEIDENMDRDLVIKTIDSYISTRERNLD